MTLQILKFPITRSDIIAEHMMSLGEAVITVLLLK